MIEIGIHLTIVSVVVIVAMLISKAMFQRYKLRKMKEKRKHKEMKIAHGEHEDKS